MLSTLRSHVQQDIDLSSTIFTNVLTSSSAIHIIIRRYGTAPHQFPPRPPPPLLASVTCLFHTSVNRIASFFRNSMSADTTIGYRSNHSIRCPSFQFLGLGTGLIRNNSARCTISFSQSILFGCTVPFGRSDHGSLSRQNRD
jgi:hypothetical protein